MVESLSVPFTKIFGNKTKSAIELTLKPLELLEVVRRVADRASYPQKDKCAAECVKVLSQPVRGCKARQDLRRLNYYFVGNGFILIVSDKKRRYCRLPFG